MDLEEAIKRISEYIGSAKNSIMDSDIDISNNDVFINIEEYRVRLRQLSWQEGLEIDKEAFKQNANNIFFSSEKEKRLILKKALLSIRVNDQNLDYNFDDLAHEFLERVWIEYKDYLHLNNSEINFIYNSAKKYFDPDNKEIYPIHPFIIEVDYMLKGLVSFSRNEFSKLTMKEFETVQLILAAKNETN